MARSVRSTSHRSKRNGPWARIQRWLFLTLVLFGSGQAVYATHAMGGELSYVCLGGSRYLVTLNFYRDCNGVAAPTNCNNGLQFRVRSQQCNANFTECFGTNPTVQVITPICPSEIDRCNSASGTYGVQRYTYTRIVDLSNYAGCGDDWMFSWSLCCRNNAITSLVSPGNQDLYLEARLNNTNNFCNNSPTFTNVPTPFYCLGQQINYTPGAVDPDGDSLVYSLANARGTNGVNLSYVNNYSPAQPIRTTGGANAVVLNPTTGTVTATPSQQQVAVVSYRVREYRQGVLVGETFRDVQFVVRTCADNGAPMASGINGTSNYSTQVCAGTPISFTVNSSDPNAGQTVAMNWNSGIPGATFTTSGAPHPTGTFTWVPTVADIGNHVFTVSVQDNGCPLVGTNAFGYSVQVTPPNTPVNAGPDQSVCGPNATLAGVLPHPSLTGTWNVVSGSGTFANASAAGTTVSGLSLGANVFRWTVGYGTCGTGSDEVVVTSYDPAHPSSDAGPDQELCLPTTSATLTGTPVTAPATGTWTLVSGSGVIASAGNSTTTVSGLAVGVNRFRWTIQNGPCAAPSQDEVRIVVFSDLQTAAAAGPDQNICSPNSSVTLTGNALIGPATGQWTRVSGSGTITAPNAATTTVTGLPVGVHRFRWTMSNGPCTNPAVTEDEMVVTVYSSGSPAVNAGPDQPLCGSSSATLSGSVPVLPAVGTWSLISGTGVFSDIHDPAAIVSGLSFGNNVFQWSVNNGPCASGGGSDQLIITRYDPSVNSANAGPDRSLCTPASTVTMAASPAPAPASGQWTLVSGSGTIMAPGSPTTTITGLTVGANVFRWTVSNGPCPVDPPSDEITVFVFDAQAPVADAGPDQSVCLPLASIQLAGNVPVYPATGQWTLVSGTAVITDMSDPATTLTGLGAGQVVLRWTIQNGSCANPMSQDLVQLTIHDPAGPVAAAGDDQDLCTPVQSTTLQGSVPLAPAFGQWTLVSGNGTIVSPNAATTLITGLAVGDNIFRWTVNNGPCPNGTTFDEVRVRVFSASNPAANAGLDRAICSGTPGVVMAASQVVHPATGTWSLVNGSGSITQPNSPTTTVTGLGPGDNVFAWTVSNGPCASGSDEMTITVFDGAVTVPDAGPDQEICIPSSPNTVTMAADPIVYPTTGQWTLLSGSGTITDPTSPTTTILDLGIGVNIFQWSINNGPCPLPDNSDVVTVRVFDAALASADAGDDQELCTPITSATLSGSALSGPATGSWTLVSGTGVFVNATSPTTTVNGLSLGNNVFRWEVDNGPCAAVSSDEVTISLFNGSAQQAQAGADQDLCTDATVLAANAATGLATAQWSVVSGTAVIDDVLDPASPVSGLGVGTNVLAWTIDNGACGSSVDQVVLRVFDPTSPAADAGLDRQLCSPTTMVELVGNAPVAPATGTWTLVSGTGFILTPNSPVTQVTGLTVGSNVFRWTVNNGPCPNSVTEDEVTIVVFNGQAQAALAGADQALCSFPVPTAVVQANAAVAPGVGSWSVNGTAVLADPNSPNTTVTDLVVGDNVLVWTIDNGICGSTSDELVIQVFDANNPMADAGPDRELCTPETEVHLAGSGTIAPASGVWTLVSGDGVIADPMDPNTLVSGLPVGVNVFRWTVSNGPCDPGTSMDEVTITVFDSSVSGADAGPDRSICLPTDQVEMAASAAPFPAVGTWTLVSGSGVIGSPNAPNTTISGLTTGANVFRWAVTNGACPVNPPEDEVVILVFDEAADPADAGVDQEVCSTVQQVQLMANIPLSPATGYWEMVFGGGNISDEDAHDPMVTGLALGENVFRWVVTNGPCADPVTQDEVSIFVHDVNAPLANAGPDQEWCTPITHVVLAGSAVSTPSVGTWSVMQGSAVITAPNDPHTTVTALGVGENILRWTVDHGPCVSGGSYDEVSIFIYDATNAAADAGPDQELCTPQSSTLMAATAVTFPATGAWSVVSGVAMIATPNDPNTSITGLGVGQVVLRWTVDNGPCATSITYDDVVIQVFDGAAPAASAGPDQEVCTPMTTVTMAGSPLVFPATGEWVLVSGMGNIVDPGNPLTTITDLPVGTHVFQWTVDNGPCAAGTTTDQVVVDVFDQSAPVAHAGPDQELCTPGTTAQLAGSPLSGPGTGQWSVVSGTATFTDEADPFTEVSGLQVGTTVLRWTVDNGPCEVSGSFDEMVITLYDHQMPVADAGPDQALCSPTDQTTMAGSAVIVPGSGQWMRVTGGGHIVAPTDPLTAITGLTIGENVFQWTVENGVCGSGPTMDLVTIMVYDATVPAANAGPDQQICTPITSAILAGSPTTFPALGTWVLISGQGTFTDPHDPHTEVTALGVGDNEFEWRVDNGACGTTADQVVITLYDLNAPPAFAGNDQEFCSPVSTAMLAGNTPTSPSVGVWSSTSLGIDFGTPDQPGTQVTGLVIGENILTWTINNGVCGITSDDVSIFIFDPTNAPANAGPDQEYCTPQDSTWLQGNTPTVPATGVWTVIDGAGVFEDATDPQTKVVGLAIGANVFVWTTDNGPCPGAITQDTVTVVLYSDSTQAANAGPDLETCLPITFVQTDAEHLQPPTTGAWSYLDGPTVPVIVDSSDPNTMVTGLAVGITRLVWTLDNGPCPNHGLMTDTLRITVFDPSGPPAEAGPDVALCTPEDSVAMAGNAPLFPGVGTWSLVSGSGTIVDEHDPQTLITDLGVGENVFLWYIYNGYCATGPPTWDTVRVMVYEATTPVADAGADQALCRPVSSTELAANAVMSPAQGSWSVVSGGALLDDPNDASSGISQLPVGITEVVWTVDNGACGITTDTVRIAVFDDLAPAADAGVDQQVCSTDPGPITLAGNTPLVPGTGEWTVTSGTAEFADATDGQTTITGLTIGDNVLTWTIMNGPCSTTSSEVTITLYDGTLTSVTAGPDQDLCSPATSATMAATAVAYPASGAWSVVSGPGTVVAPNDPQSVVQLNGTGAVVLVWTLDNGPCAASITDTVVVTVFDSGALTAQAGEDRSFCSADPVEAEMMAIGTLLPAVGSWSVSSGSAVIADPLDPNTLVSGLGLGGTLLTWTVDNGACGTTSDDIWVNVYDPSEPAAQAGTGRVQCSDTLTVQLAAQAVVTTTATGHWSVVAGTAEFDDASDPHTEVSGLTLGDNLLVWTVENGACGTTADTILVHIKDCSILVVPDAYSPNGDGVNDTYVVLGLEYYPKNSFQVFNRWGSKVLDRKPYRNDWDGRSEGSMNWGEELPESTYYFVLDPGDGKDVITGYIYLRR